VEIATVKDWDAEEQPRYVWRTDHEVLYWRRGLTDALLYEHNIRTQRDRRIWHCIAHADAPSAFPAVSPDGRWLFWVDRVDEEGDYLLSMPRRHKIPLPKSVTSHAFGFDQTYWMPDSRHWLMLDWVTDQDKFHPSDAKRLLIGEVHSPRRVRTLALAKRSPLRRYGQSIWDSLCLLSQRRLLVSGLREDIQDTLPIYELSLDRNAMPVREFRVHLPRHTCLADYAFSPRDGEIALLLSASESGRGARWQLWQSDYDGSRLHGVANLPGSSRDDFGERGDLQWLPDGKHISFLYKDVLYRVTANGQRSNRGSR
jgi:hypothetical protein